MTSSTSLRCALVLNALLIAGGIESSAQEPKLPKGKIVFDLISYSNTMSIKPNSLVEHLNRSSGGESSPNPYRGIKAHIEFHLCSMGGMTKLFNQGRFPERLLRKELPDEQFSDMIEAQRSGSPQLFNHYAQDYVKTKCRRLNLDPFEFRWRPYAITKIGQTRSFEIDNDNSPFAFEIKSVREFPERLSDFGTYNGPSINDFEIVVSAVFDGYVSISRAIPLTEILNQSQKSPGRYQVPGREAKGLLGTSAENQDPRSLRFSTYFVAD